jgi:hypothetical protein
VFEGNVLNLAAPPRPVPLSVRILIRFGGFMNQFGWFFVGFGLIFVWIFTLRADVTSWYYFRGPLAETTGTVTRTEHSGFTEGDGSDHGDGLPIYAYYYTFIAEDGLRYDGVSYSTVRPRDEGEKVGIEYPLDKPDISRIKGMQRSPVGLLGAMSAIFPIIGIFFIIPGIRKARRAIRLLTIGEQTTAHLKSSVKTNTEINDRPVYKLTFEFETRHGQISQATAKTHLVENLEDEHDEPLLYDPMEPSNAVMLDSLPGLPRIDADGQIRASSGVSALFCLAVPVATVVGHTAYLFWRFVF